MNDFLGNPIAVGDVVYRNEKLHKVVKIAGPGKYGKERVKVDCIYPYTWTEPKILPATQFVVLHPTQVTAFLLTHTLPSKQVSGALTC